MFFFLFLAPGPNLPEEKLVVTVNWYGVSFQEGKEKTYLTLSYPEVTGVQVVRFVFLVLYQNCFLNFEHKYGSEKCSCDARNVLVLLSVRTGWGTWCVSPH